MILNRPDQHAWTRRELMLAVLAFAFMLFIHGAVPFLMLPTLGQAVWSLGFAQSFAHGPLFDLYAQDIGIPQPAAIAFGLAGAWPASLLIRVGLHPADAYSGVAALWLGLAFFSAFKIARRVGATVSVSLFGALLWLSMPIVWGHAGYSMLSWGMALLSFYFFCALRLFASDSGSVRRLLSSSALYLSAAVIAVFMDGYTFMMFASGASILLLYLIVVDRDRRAHLLKRAILVHLVSLALAYVLYTRYVHTTNFQPVSIDFFRGWGLDLSFIAVPTRGMFWWADALGLSVKRTDAVYFGDASVWRTTFFLPVLVLGVLAWWRTRRSSKLSLGIFIAALFGVYMALGPSLKIDAQKPASLEQRLPYQQSALMPAQLAIAPTGSAWISEKLPGFKLMRASYRWSALGIFCLWWLLMLWAAQSGRRYQPIWLAGLAALILINLPNLKSTGQSASDSRTMLAQIDSTLVAELARDVRPGEKVAFIPWNNDFMANYVAPSAGFRTFNIGGDKNLAAARAHWPSEMGSLRAIPGAEDVPAAVRLLANGAADAVVVPYVHMLWSAHFWPCVAETSARLTEDEKEGADRIPDFLCPGARENQLQPYVQALARSEYVEVAEGPLFAVARLRPEFSGSQGRAALQAAIFGNVRYPLTASSKQLGPVLGAGWYPPEPTQVWSRSDAELTLPIPDDCKARHCAAVLKFIVFGASEQRAVAVVFQSADQSWQWQQELSVSSSDPVEVTLPLTDAAAGVRRVSISVPAATSPLALTGSADARSLGIALERIELKSQ